MKRGGTITPATRVDEHRRQPDSDHGWRVVSNANGRKMGTSGEGYRNKRDMRAALWSVAEGVLAWCFERNRARAEAMIERIRAAVSPSEA